LCERTGADVDEIARAIGADTRIGAKFLRASVGFGGSCFQKDILNLVYLCRHFNSARSGRLLGTGGKMNDYQKHRFAKQIITDLFNTLSGKKITFLGWAFKKDTNDTRESAAIYVAYELLQEQAEIHVFDPKVSKQQMIDDIAYVAKLNGEEQGRTAELIQRIVVHNQPYEATSKAHAIAILTEWSEFTAYNWQLIYNQMYKPAFLFDGRNLLDHKKLVDIGFRVKAIGKAF
jgi:UDPglucose 6-dehydrogenase